MSETLEHPIDAPLLSRAFALAAELHDHQKRKGPGQVPYLAHLLSVTALAFEHGATSTEAAAALLHDAIEDGGGEAVAERVEQACGPSVVAVVRSCSDSTADTRSGADKDPWRVRKERYIAHLSAGASPSALLVSACDKLHNLTTTVTDLGTATDRSEVWGRFKTGWQGQRWYYASLLAVYERSGDTRVQDVAAGLAEQLRLLDDVIRSDGNDPAVAASAITGR